MSDQRVNVRVRDGRQIVTDLGHHYGGEILTVPARLARQWVRYGWADETTDPNPSADHPAARVPTAEGQGADDADGATAEPEPVPSSPRGRGNVRVRVAEELRADALRSDREIAKVVGCDHKTVGSVRRELQDADEPPQTGA
ncbi:hypothetical protein SMC26_32945 [Actinomadura fulvescens]|uniref:Transposase n=1 Tax=Actinomadura fulvescens TaxID=46160 RepID=A0ABN3QBR1_9ACTN